MLNNKVRSLVKYNTSVVNCNSFAMPLTNGNIQFNNNSILNDNPTPLVESCL